MQEGARYWLPAGRVFYSIGWGTQGRSPTPSPIARNSGRHKSNDLPKAGLPRPARALKLVLDLAHNQFRTW